MKKRRIIKLTVILASSLALLIPIIAGATVASFFTGYEIYSDVKYGDKAANVMDIYMPSEAYERESNGCVLFIHGGSWIGGDKADEAARCQILASRGYIAATMNYTLWSEDVADEYTVSTVLDEIDLALSAIKEFSAQKGVKIDKAATAGYSAGAHLSMLYSFSKSDTAPVEIVFSANLAGPADICTEIWGEDMTLTIAKILTGEDISAQMLESGAADELLKSISPVYYIDEKTPPSIIMQGGKDNIVPPDNADSLVEKFTQSGVTYDYVYLNRSDHSLAQNPLKHMRFFKILAEYCEKYFA